MPSGAELQLATGCFDDERRRLAPGHALYPAAVYAFEHRDYWTDDEHARYWSAHHGIWPARKGRSSDKESLAFAILIAATWNVSAAELAQRLGFGKNYFRDSFILDLAAQMEADLAKPSQMRLPRVMTVDEYDHRPLMGHFRAIGGTRPACLSPG